MDCDITGNITKTIELVNDSLASLSEEEVKQALASGFLPVTLGDSRLRTETAGVVAVSAVQFVNQ